MTIKIKGPTAREIKAAAKKEWSDKYMAKIDGIHIRNKAIVVEKIMKRAETLRSSLAARSKKYNVECKVTVEELRELILQAYGSGCRYCDRQIILKNMVVDHKIPISKGGTSNIDNLQIICKTSNSMKGSLDEENFSMLLNWLETVPEELSKDIRIRLARGIN